MPQLTLQLSSLSMNAGAITPLTQLLVLTDPSFNEFGNFACANATGLKAIKAVGALERLSTMGIGVFARSMSMKQLEMKLPLNLTNIPDNTFYGCQNMTDLQLPPNIETIGNSAFQLSGVRKFNNSGLQLKYLGIGAESNVMYNMLKLQSVDLSGSELVGQSNTVLDNTFSSYNNLSYGGPLGGSPNLQSISLSPQVISIGNNSFTPLQTLPPEPLPLRPPLTTINMYGITVLPDYFATGCNALSTLNVGQLTSIGNYALYNCYSLITLDTSTVTSIGTYGIAGTGVSLLDISSITSLDVGSLSGNLRLTSVTLPTTNLTLPDYCFQGDYILNTIVNLNKVSQIGNYTFQKCHSLNTLDLTGLTTSIGNYAFDECNELVQITLPSTSITIGTNAFQYNISLTTINLENVLSIGDYAFQECINLTNVDVSLTTYLGNHIFYNCLNLISVTLPNIIINISDNLFDSCINLPNIILPTSVNSIGAGAFNTCVNLALGANDLQNIISIGNNAFENCANIISINLSSIIDGSNLGISAFQNCAYLTNIIFADELTSLINDKIFFSCSGLISIDLKNITSLLSDSINNTGIFGLCSSLTTIVGLKNVTIITNNAFFGCSSLTSVDLTSAVTINGAFSNCTGLISADLSSNTVLQSLNGTFFDCTSLQFIYLPSSITSLGIATFDRCSSLTTIDNLENCINLTEIGNDSFKLCKSLTSIILPLSILSIGANAFKGCSLLNTFTLPLNIISINITNFFGSFENCPNLKTINYWNAGTIDLSTVFPNPSLSTTPNYTIMTFNYYTTNNSNWYTISEQICTGFNGSNIQSIFIPNIICTSIAPSAFQNCTSLTGVTIPESVTSIGDYAFDGCTNNKTIIFDPPHTLTIGNHSFQNNTSIKTLYIPEFVTNIGDYAFYGCTSLTIITIVNPNTIIGYKAFGNCPSLKIVYYCGKAYHFPSKVKVICCFNEDTQILCINENLEEVYIPIQDIRKGTIVKSYKYGPKKVEAVGKGTMINDPTDWTKCMYTLPKNNNINPNSLDDLIITGRHSILVDNLPQHIKQKQDKLIKPLNRVINNKYLLIAGQCEEFTQITTNEVYTYYHFILENDGDENKKYGIWANGILAETTTTRDFYQQQFILL